MAPDEWRANYLATDQERRKLKFSMGFHTPQQCECGGWARETRWSPSPAAALHLDVEPELDDAAVGHPRDGHPKF
jgi:hypothetical protein